MTAPERRAALRRSDLRGVPLGHLLEHMDLDVVRPLTGCPLCSEGPAEGTALSTNASV